MAERAPPPTPETIRYENQSFHVKTTVGTMILSYRFPSEVLQEPTALHIWGTGFGTVPINNETYFDKIIPEIGGTHVVITWAGMTKEQVDMDKRNGIQTVSDIDKQVFGMTDVRDHILSQLKAAVSRIVFHGYSLGARVGLQVFGQDIDSSTRALEMAEKFGLTPGDVKLILEMPAFGIHPDILEHSESRSVMKASRSLYKRFPWIINNFGDHTVQKILLNLINERKIYNSPYHNKIARSRVLHPGTSASHLASLRNAFDPTAFINRALIDGFNPEVIAVTGDGLVDTSLIQNFEQQHGHTYWLGQELTHTAHIHHDREALLNAYKSIFELSGNRMI